MRFFAVFCFLFLAVTVSVAKPLNDGEPNFDIKQANQTFDHINIQLSTENLNQDNLKAAIDTLSDLTEQAEQCVDVSQKRLSSIDTLIKQGANPPDKNTTGADLLYLDTEQKKMASRQAQCRLFLIRAKEAIDAFNTTVAHLNQEETLARGLPLWKIINQLIQQPPVEAFHAASEIQLPTILLFPMIWIILTCTALIVSFVLLFKLRKNRFSKRYLHMQTLGPRYALLLAASILTGTLCLYLTIMLQDSDSSNLFIDLSKQVFFYLSALTIIMFLSKLKRIRALSYSYSIDPDFCLAALVFSASFYMLYTVGRLIANTLNFSNVLVQLSHTLFLLAMIVTGIYFVYYFCRTHRHLRFIKHHKHLVPRLGLLILSTCALISILGYYPLAIRLASSILMTFIITFITILIIQGINKIHVMFTQQNPIKTQLIKYFGYKQDEGFTEFVILKITTQIIIIALSLYLILRSWGFATYFIESAFSQLISGIHLANTTIYPTRIVLGVVVYCLLYLLFRGISTAISRHQQFEDEEETQVAIASIFTYIGFGLALISALLVAGFNFTGLAIVAGALSVGIGLGLQSIVNNFVSGLILLIEKPIKPGDRINIDGVEGFVKKIRVRSTHIITPAQEDIIVPNSDLITRRVTNYVYSNKQLSILCDINVPLGCDTQLVRKLFLQAANNHEEVIKTGRNKPSVLFRAFGEKALLFQLCCLIKDVNKKLQVQSDLNFAVDQLLRENNI